MKTSHRTIPYDHLQKESKRGADSFGAVVVCSHVNVAIRVVHYALQQLYYMYMILFVTRLTKQLFQVRDRLYQ